MMKRVLASLVAIGMATQLAGCTSSGPKEETDAATSPDASEFSDESKGDFTDGVKNAEGGDAVKPPGDVAAAPVDGAGENLDLDAPVDAPADTAAASPTPDKGGDLSLEDADPEHEFPENVAQAPPSTDAPPADAQAAAPAPTDEQLFAAKPSDEAKPQDATAQAAPEPPLAAEAKPVRAVVFAPLMKVKDQPFSQKGALLNRVYISRQTDTWKGVSAKVYGSDKAKDLKRWNPGIASRALKVGDKVYYNSPKDPSDNSRMLSYYEEQGTPAQVYTTKDGDNLRKVGKDLLGDKDSWKELWVTNRDLASKGALPAGVDVKYWNDAAGAGAPAQTMASQQPPADGSDWHDGSAANIASSECSTTSAATTSYSCGDHPDARSSASASTCSTRCSQKSSKG